MDTRHLRTAVAVARHRSFTLAARELFMAQSTVTRQVACLERELGRRLFVRRLRSVEPTPEGAAFLPEVERILEELRLAVEAARAAAAVPAPRGELPAGPQRKR